jgi:hypothetical protein
MLRILIAMIAAALFAGAALAASLSESGLRARLERRIGGVQLGLALASLALGAWAWWKTGITWLIVGAALIGLAFLVSLFAGRSAPAADSATTAGGAAPARGGALHGVRTICGLASVAAYLMAFIQP